MAHQAQGDGEYEGLEQSPTNIFVSVITRLVRVIHLWHSQMMKGYVYILASKKNGTLYTGVTSNPSRRILEHNHELTPGFTSRYGVKTLVWMEAHDLVVDTIRREKAIKKYPRAWKINLIEAVNPDWADLSTWLMDT